jgi:murein L,D-transpeptidase YafK
MKNKLLISIFLLLLNVISLSQTKSEKIITNNKPLVQKRLLQLDIKQVNSVYIRVFKFESQMQLWIDDGTKWHLYRTYDICGKSGQLGRKMITNDRQIPEGIYQITQFNQNSQYHLSLKLNYPNKADFYFSDSTKPGDEIFIHGGCASIGCVAINDDPIEEVWTILNIAKNRTTPVHIFSIMFNNNRSNNILQTFAYTKEDMDFQEQMRKIFYFWEYNRRVPKINIDKKGNYVISEEDLMIQRYSSN